MKVLNKVLVRLCERMYQAVIDRDLAEVKAEVDSITSQLVDDLSMNNMENLQEMLERYQKWTDAVFGAFDTEEEKIAYQMGILAGTVSAIAHLKEIEERIRECSRTHFDTKYWDDIIEYLADKDHLQHNQLAKKLDMDPSQLTTIMNKLDEEGQDMIAMSRTGKFKYYCLTDIGRRYYHNRHKGNFREEIVELMQCVLDSQASDKNDTVKHFADKYYHDDLEVKQKAVEVDAHLYLIGHKSRDVEFLRWDDVDTGRDLAVSSLPDDHDLISYAYEGDIIEESMMLAGMA